MARKRLDTTTEANNAQELAEIAVTDQQAAVIRAIVSGATQKAAAGAVGVSEYTVSRWANSDPHYIAALNLARLDAWQEQRAELRKLLVKAREGLEYVLGGNDAGAIVKAAALILEQFAAEPAGPVTVEDAKIMVKASSKDRWQRDCDATIKESEVLLNLW